MGKRARLFSQSSTIFAARLFGAGLVFLAQAVIARLWGSAILGQYLLLIAMVNVAAMILPLGFQTVGTYFAAEYRAKAQRRQLWRFMGVAYAHVLLGGLLLALGFDFLLGLVGAAGANLYGLKLPAILFATATAFVFVNGALLVGLKRPYSGFFAEAIVRPMLLVAAIAITVAAFEEMAALAPMMWLFAGGYSVVAVGQFVWVIRSVAQVDNSGPALHGEFGRWWWYAAPWVLIALATDFFFDLDLFVLAALLGPEDLAVFGVAARIFALASFGVAAVYAVTLPDMFEDAAHADRAGFLHKVGEANLVATSLALALFVATGLGGWMVLWVFGPEFLAGAGPLTVLCFALVVRSAFGPASLVLSIHEHPYASLPAVLLGLAALVGGNLVLVPMFGLMGAAVAALVAISLWSAILWATARYIAGLDVSIVPLVTERLAARNAAKALDS